MLPALRALLELPFEHVIVSHGEPVPPVPPMSAPSSALPGADSTDYGEKLTGFFKKIDMRTEISNASSCHFAI